MYVLINFNFTEYDLSTSIMSLGLKKNNQHESINRCMFSLTLILQNTTYQLVSCP